MRSTKPTTCIENLPPEMISELFEYLHPKDLIACSLVNKRWHSIYAAFKLHRLVVTDYPDSDPDYYIIKWGFSNQPIQEAERCCPAMFLRLVEKPLLSNLRQLTLSGDDLEFDLNELNRFPQLVHLEIDTYLAGEVHLNLSRLKVLVFHDCNEECAWSIDCPELSTLEYSEEKDANLLEVKHPETIRKLETNMLGPKLAPFKNVECLFIEEFEAISKATLLSLPRLRELRYDLSIEYIVEYEFNYEVGALDRLKRSLSKFVGEAKRLRGSDFRFTFAGFQLTNVNVDQIDFGAEFDEEDEEERACNEYVYMENYHLIEPDSLHFLERIDYTRLLSNVTGEFPRCFFEKFTGIQIVQVDGLVKDPNHLLWFLKSLRSLNWLELDAELNQEFYDQLPAAACSLTRLELRRDKFQLNFSDFPHLSVLTIEQPSLESFSSLFRTSVKLVNVRFDFGLDEDYTLSIKKGRGSLAWKISDGSRTLFEAKSTDEVISFYAGFRAARLASN